MLAIIHHLDSFRHILLGGKFLVRTDRAALKYWRRFKNPEGQMARWLDFMSQFGDMEIEARPGLLNRNADGLYRKHEDCMIKCKKKCFCEAFSQLEYEPPVVLESRHFVEMGVQTTPEPSSDIEQCDKIEVSHPINLDDILCETMACQTCVVETLGVVNTRTISILPYLTVEQMKKDQESDPDIGPVMKLLNNSIQKPKWPDVAHLSHESKILIIEWQRLEIQDGLLYRKWENEIGNKCWWQLAIPRKYRSMVLEHAHDHVTTGHEAIDRTVSRIKLRLFWPKMSDYIALWVKSCPICQARKSPNKNARAPLQPYTVGSPFERVTSDITGPYTESESGFRSIVCFTDTFTKFTIATPIRTMKASDVVDAFLRHWVAYFSIPLELHTDKGSQYESELFREMCEVLGIDKTRTCTMNPQSNGGVERIQKSLTDMLNCVANYAAGARC